MFEIRRQKGKSKTFWRIYRADGKFMQTYDRLKHGKRWIELYGETHAIK